MGQRRSWEGRDETGGVGRARSWRASHVALKDQDVILEDGVEVGERHGKM